MRKKEEGTSDTPEGLFPIPPTCCLNQRTSHPALQPSSHPAYKGLQARQQTHPFLYAHRDHCARIFVLLCVFGPNNAGCDVTRIRSSSGSSIS